ncbi:MAG: DUF4330 domain-containing protein [Clostridia bacterium]|nr:DUF4330 domain-containing protein [Clostridia bacterium]MBQ3077446.1 DUF4330 domain-containing protein [Clostridia bacterium]
MAKKTAGGRGKLFGLLNILDLVILVFLISLGFALVLRGGLKDDLGTSADDVKVAFTLRIEPVRVMTYMAIAEGDPVFDEETGSRIGTVTKVTASPYQREVTMEDGTLMLSPDPEYLCLIVSAEGVGKESENGILLNGTRFCSPGANIKLGFPNVTTTGRFNTVKLLP